MISVRAAANTAAKEDDMESSGFRSPGDESDTPAKESHRLRDLLGNLPRTRLTFPRLPTRRMLLFALLLMALWTGHRLLKGSFQPVPPGTVGVCVSRFTGSIRVLPPGTHFRPPTLYEIHRVRISDQLLTGEEGTFSISTKEGVAARLSIQARWAIDRNSLSTRWAALPPEPGRELVGPIVAAAFRAAAPGYEVASLISEKREEYAAAAARNARQRLAESGIVLKEVLIGNITLPEDFERGRVAMVDEIQKTERMDVTLKLKTKEVEQTRLEAEAQKAKQLQQAEAAAQQRVIQARGESDAMKFILTLKEKEIQQKKLEAEADRETRVQRAKADSEIARIAADAEAGRRKTMADAEAYSIRKTSEAQFENLQREAELVSAHPLMIPKTFADRISDKVQVILTPTIGGEAFTDEVVRRAAGKASAGGATKAASSRTPS
ncbi:MAG: SPFH domain-containing protein [Acidobacteriota bacterium]